MTAIFNVYTTGGAAARIRLSSDDDLEGFNAPLVITNYSAGISVNAGNNLYIRHRYGQMAYGTTNVSIYAERASPIDDINYLYGLYLAQSFVTAVNYSGIYHTLALLQFRTDAACTIARGIVLWPDFHIRNTATLSAGHLIYATIDAAGSTISNLGTVWITNPSAGIITNICGVTIDEQGLNSTNRTNLYIGAPPGPTLAIPTGHWSLYNISTRNNLMAGPTINYAMSKEDDFDSAITWSVGAAGAGIMWRLTLAGAGAIAQTANARGGIVSITSTINTPSWLDEYANTGWSVQDYPVLYCRFRTLETANTMKAVGFTDAVNAGVNLPYTTNALLITVDTSIGNFFYLTGVVAAARVNVSTTVALDANYHTFMLMPKYLPATGAFDGYELWVDGVYKCAIPAANVPIAATMMQALPAYAGNLAGAVMSTIFVDTVKFSQRRNTGTAA